MDIIIYEPIDIRDGYQRIYGTIKSILYNMVEKIAAIPNIYGARAIFLQCCDHQDTQSE